MRTIEICLVSYTLIVCPSCGLCSLGTDNDHLSTILLSKFVKYQTANWWDKLLYLKVKEYLKYKYYQLFRNNMNCTNVRTQGKKKDCIH